MPRKVDVDGHHPLAKTQAHGQKKEAVSSLLEKLGSMSTDTDYSDATQELDKYLYACHDFAAHWFAPILEQRIREKVQEMEAIAEQETGVRDMVLPQRTTLVHWINQECRDRGLAIVSNGTPCRIATASYSKYPEIGRFQLIPVGSSQGIDIHKDINKFFPLALTKSPRREPDSRWADQVLDDRKAGGKRRIK